MKGIRILGLISFVLWMVSCSSTKFVGEGEYLLDDVKIVSDTKAYKPSDLKPYLRQQPNFKAFIRIDEMAAVFVWLVWAGCGQMD